MKLLLCSDFSGVGYRYLKRFKVNLKNKKCLFIGYAQDDENESESSAAVRLKMLGLDLIYLKPDYKFQEKIDIIFVRGGNTTRLIHLLRENDQFEKIKEMILSNVVYIGNSAGAILVGGDTSWTLKSEPYNIDLQQKFGKNALFGFNLILKTILVHSSKYRLFWDDGFKNIYRDLDLECYPAYLKEVRQFKKGDYIKIGNNQVYFVDGEKEKLITYDWKNIAIKKR